MANTWDVIVVGLGAMGSATLHQLAKRGHHVLGIEQFVPGHGNGSSHGKSRIIREAYFEDPRYVPLVQRAYECWRELEADSGVTVLRQTGGLMLGSPESYVVAGARHSAELHGLPHEIIDAAEVRRRYPAFHPAAHEIGVVEPRAGMLAPELAITTFMDCALEHQGDHHERHLFRRAIDPHSWCVGCEGLWRIGDTVHRAAERGALVHADPQCCVLQARSFPDLHSRSWRRSGMVWLSRHG
jgi:glycine/D-amino acid oxidase-like deaminating enzyme